MRRSLRNRLLIGAIGATSLVLLAAHPAGAGVYLNTVGDTATVHGGGHRLAATVIIGCTEGERIRFELTVIQGESVAVGRGAGRCNGAPYGQQFEVVVAGTRKATFHPGEAHASAWAETRHGQHIHPRRTWTTAITLDRHEPLRRANETP